MNCFTSRSTKRFRLAKIAVATLLSCATPAVCWAQPNAAARASTTDENARLVTLFRAGVAAFEAGKDEEAVKVLGEAWAIRQTYDIAGALAQAEISLKRYRDAAEHLNFGINHFVPGDSEQTLEQMRVAFVDVKKHVAALKITVDRDGAEVSAGGRAIGVSPIHGPAFLDPGARTLEARLDGQKVSQVVNVEAGQEYPVTLKLGSAKITPGPGASGAADDDPSIVPVIVGGAVALVGAAGFVLFDSAASSDTDTKNRLKAINGPSGCADGSATQSDCTAQLDAARSHDRNRNLAVASIVVGAAGLASIPIYWFWPREKAAAVTAQKPALRLHGAVSIGSVSILGEF